MKLIPTLIALLCTTPLHATVAVNFYERDGDVYADLSGSLSLSFDLGHFTGNNIDNGGNNAYGSSTELAHVLQRSPSYDTYSGTATSTGLNKKPTTVQFSHGANYSFGYRNSSLIVNYDTKFGSTISTNHRWVWRDSTLNEIGLGSLGTTATTAFTLDGSGDKITFQRAANSTISWSSAQNFTGLHDINQNGGHFRSFNAGGSGTIDLNNDSFLAANPLGTSISGFLNGADTGDADLNAMLDTASSSGTTSATIDLGQFDIGQTYEIQVFYMDQRDGENNNQMTFGDSFGSSTATLEADPNNDANSPYGQYVIGRFTATGFDPDLIITDALSSDAQITGWQIRQVAAVPEPSSSLLIFLSGLTLLLRRKR